jgi:hypothetical protein
VIVVGDANYLGQWNPEAGILMSVVGPDLFEAEIKIPNNCNTIIQYKYCSIEQNDPTINWESGENRLLTLPSNIFVVQDLYTVSYALKINTRGAFYANLRYFKGIRKQSSH